MLTLQAHSLWQQLKGTIIIAEVQRSTTGNKFWLDHKAKKIWLWRNRASERPYVSLKVTLLVCQPRIAELILSFQDRV